ncbi:hypothetical protein GCM10023093_15220 [Nemorincola caseinilytica]|uniref:Gliding motility protein GldL-like N-terminal domain-containing protein n=1 Tax=Nemorincola caseinilytica TaxID=2054315 RepID=A0ABP8NBW9_9BACT
MYRISDEQVEYILDDIRRGGIETEDLQLNLLDHICCIIERELEPGADFERFYRHTLRRFYKSQLREIEEETARSLTFKNYYSMKKLMLMSGALSTASLIAGSIFKIQHWPGAGVLLALGIASFSLLFLPLLAILKAREVAHTRDRIVLTLACLLGIVFSMATLFTIMHWPGASALWFTAIGISAFVLLPVYFFTGIRRPETKLNTMLISILLVGFTGLQFTLMNTRPGKTQAQIRIQAYLQSEALLHSIQPSAMSPTAAYIDATCEQIKTLALEHAASDPATLLREGRPGDQFIHDGTGVRLIRSLRDSVAAYDRGYGAEILPIRNTVLDGDPTQIGYVYTNVSLLQAVSQLQLYLATAEGRKLATAAK